MPDYFIRAACRADCARIAQVYNSNPRFLLRHLGAARVDERFIEEEFEQMRRAGFCPCVIVQRGDLEIRGTLDYRSGPEVYLSLLMLEAGLQGKGIGRRIYQDFEMQMRRAGSASVRIDVVCGYPGSASGFWEKLGFRAGESVALQWGEKKSPAVVMRKKIGGPER